MVGAEVAPVLRYVGVKEDWSWNTCPLLRALMRSVVVERLSDTRSAISTTELATAEPEGYSLRK